MRRCVLPCLDIHAVILISTLKDKRSLLVIAVRLTRTTTKFVASLASDDKGLLSGGDPWTQIIRINGEHSNGVLLLPLRCFSGWWVVMGLNWPNVRPSTFTPFRVCSYWIHSWLHWDSDVTRDISGLSVRLSDSTFWIVPVQSHLNGHWLLSQ